MTAPWITYRPELKVLDCTIRDGGLINDHAFEDGFVRAVYETCIEAGVDYMEIGYKASRRLFAPDRFGAWKYCREDDIRRIVGEKHNSLKLAAMTDAEKTDYHEDVLPRDQSILDVIRVATYVHQIPTAVDMIKDAHDKGYEVTANLMAVSVIKEIELDQALEVLSQTPVSTIIVVDSYGALYAEQIELLVKKYLEFARATGKVVGVHAHNNQQLAFANTIEAIIHGANLVDATMAGLGRGAGNCPMELLLGFLRNPKFHLRPVYKLLQEHVPALRGRYDWGPLPPYNITGQMNQHPRAAIAWLSAPEKDHCLDFYEKCLREEP